MNDEEFERQKTRIATLRERWWKPLGVGWWDIEFKFVRTDFAVDGNPEPDTIAYTTCDWRYMHGTVHWNMPQVREIDDDELERAFVHEAVHILLQEVLNVEQRDHHERVTTTLTKAFLWLRDELLMDINRPLNGSSAGTTPVSVAWTNVSGSAGQ